MSNTNATRISLGSKTAIRGERPLNFVKCCRILWAEDKALYGLLPVQHPVSSSLIPIGWSCFFDTVVYKYVPMKMKYSLGLA
jgi:hypothetical protein